MAQMKNGGTRVNSELINIKFPGKIENTGIVVISKNITDEEAKMIEENLESF